MKRKIFLRPSIVVISCLLILSLPIKYTQHFRQKLWNLFKLPLKSSAHLVNFFIHYLDYKSLILENKLLYQKNIELSLENANLNYLKKENEDLRKLLEFRKQLPYQSLAAEVIGLDYAKNRKIIFLDRGSDQMVFENMVCFNSAGLVGKVMEVGNHISKVICLNDPNLRVPAKIENRHELGLVYGTINGAFLEMRYLAPDAQVEVGERVITSGLGEIYPKGILIGKISQIQTGRFYTTALISPAVDFFRLEQVLLIKK